MFLTKGLYKGDNLQDSQISDGGKYIVNSMNIIIPYQYVISHTLITWSDIRFGIENNFLNRDNAIAHAVSTIQKTKAFSKDLEELACLFNGEEIEPFLSNLSNEECTNENKIKEKWLYLILRWVYEHKYTLYNNPLDMIENIYSDFGYPRTIVGLVRYMPSDHYNDEGEKGLFRAWANYLAQQGLLYSKDLI